MHQFRKDFLRAFDDVGILQRRVGFWEISDNPREISTGRILDLEK
jgi:hypothetical protein